MGIPLRFRLIQTTILLILFSQLLEARQASISTVEEIARDFQRVPCSNKERLEAARALFEKMQAPAASISATISVDKLRDVDNLVVRQSGASNETIVVGAHYDIAELGCGAIDNWTGVVTLAHLYRTIRAFNTQKTVLFVAFGKEEKGLIGSKAMVAALAKDQIPNYCAMINIDSFGMAAPFALQGSSSPPLVNLAEEVSQELKIPFSKVIIKGADSDSSSFLASKIPAVTLSGLSNDWQSILHTTFDQPKKVNPNSVYLGYRLALSMWGRVEQAPCDSYR